MEVYVLEVYDQGERIASLDVDGNWECSDYEKLKEVVSLAVGELLPKQLGGRPPNDFGKYTHILLQRV